MCVHVCVCMHGCVYMRACMCVCVCARVVNDRDVFIELQCITQTKASAINKLPNVSCY